MVLTEEHKLTPRKRRLAPCCAAHRCTGPHNAVPGGAAPPVPPIMPLHQPPERRWLSLYSTDFVALADAAAKPTSPSPPPSPPPPPPPPPAVSMLPDAVLRSILRRLDPEGLSAAAQVCRAWRTVAYEPAGWRAHAARAWPREPLASVERLLWFGAPPAPYGTWRQLVARRPRLRAGGVYMKRHHYVKSRRGVCLNGEPAPAVSLVTYWRLLRFYSDGTVVSLVTPERPDKAVRRLRLNWEPQPHESAKAHPSVGSWTFSQETRTAELTVRWPSAPHSFFFL